jgi:polyisoprenoid-binding protein YceI
MTSSNVATIPGYRAGTWAVDPVHSEIGFSVRHMMVSNVRGRFTGFEAVIVTAESVLDSTATATIAMASVSTGNDQRDDDLRSERFFDVDAHPEMTFSSTGVRADDDGLLLDGELTIRGITRPITLQVEIGGFGPDPFGKTRAGFSATSEIQRSDFGMTGNMLIEGGGVVIADKVKIHLELEAVLQSDATPSGVA